MGGNSQTPVAAEGSNRWAVARCVLLCYTLPLFVRGAELLQGGGGGGASDDDDVVAPLAGLALWALCVAALCYRSLRPAARVHRATTARRRPRHPPRRTPRPDIKPHSKGGVRFRLQGGSVREGAAQQCTATWWDEARDALVLRENGSGHSVLTIPWRTVTRGCLDIGDDIESKEPATVLLQCQPVLRDEMAKVAVPMLVKLYLTDYSDIECLRSCLITLGLSKTRRLWWWLGHDWCMSVAYHRCIAPTSLSYLAYCFGESLGFCTKLAAGSKMLKLTGVVELVLDLLLVTLQASLNTPLWLCVLPAVLMLLWRYPVRSVFVLCGAALACGAVYLLLYMGSLRASVVKAYPAFGSLESAVLLSGPASVLLFKTMPSALRSALEVFSFDLCHPKRPLVVRKFSVFVRACRYHHISLPRYIYACFRDREVMALLSAARKPATDCSVYRDELYDHMSSMHAQDADGEYQKCDCRYKADVLISYLEAYKFHVWGDVLSSASFHRCHYVLDRILRRWASRSNVEAAILIAARRGYTDVLTTLHTHLVAHHTCLLPVRGGDGSTILHTAAIHGHEGTVTSVLAKAKLFGVKVTDCTESGLTALHCASLSGKDALALWLLSQVRDCGQAWETTHDGRTVLHCAAAGGAVKTIAKIVAQGHRCSPDHASDATPTLLPLTKDGRTPLHCAAEKGKYEAVKLLLESLPKNERTAQLEAKTSRGWTVLHCACGAAPHVCCAKTVELLLEAGADPQTTTTESGQQQSDTALELAIDCGNSKLVSCLVGKTPEPCRPSSDGRTVLHRVKTRDCLANLTFLYLGFITEEATLRLLYSSLTKDGRSVLHCAAEKGLWDVYSAFKQALSEQGAAVPETTKEGLTHLHCAAQRGHLSMVSKLMEQCKADADYQAASTRGDTPLHLAVREGHEHVVSKLVGTAAGRTAVAAVNSDGDTPLHLAAKCSSIDATKDLLRAGADVSVRNGGGYTPLHLTSSQALARLLIEKGADVHALGQGRMPLNLSAERGDTAVVKLLLREMKKAKSLGCDARVIHPPLHDAAEGGHTEVVATLCEWDRSVVRQRSREGTTALHVAAENGWYKTVEVLCAADANATAACTVDVLEEVRDEAPIVSSLDGNRQTPLHRAAKAGHLKTVKVLLAQKTLTRAAEGPDVEGRTPLHYAAIAGHAEIAKIVQPHDTALYNATDQDGRTPLHYAVVSGSLETVDAILLTRGAEACGAQDVHARTPLHYAALEGHLPIVATLSVAGGAGVRGLKDIFGTTPVDLALRSGHSNVVRHLEEHEAHAVSPAAGC